jgi:RimJ/RimL family protein N-acetyltransferase
MANFERLARLAPAELTARTIRLERLADRHREPLRAACAEDREIWAMYPYSLVGEHFDAWWARTGERIVYVALAGAELIGMSSYYDLDPVNDSLAIGGTYFAPRARGTGANSEVKRLMLEAAFACGVRRVVFHVDAINARSRGAVEKLGAHLDGVMRQDRATWTGRVRDTCVYSILAEEWPAVRASLDAATREA